MERKGLNFVKLVLDYSHPTLKLPMENLPKALLYGGSMTGNFPAGKE